jgi:hypothetical protein
VQVISRRALSSVLAAALALLGAAACSPDLPPALPSTAAYARFASRVELVDLVISDPARAAKVRNLYLEIEASLLATRRTNASQIAALGARKRAPGDEESTRALVKKVRDAELAAFQRYIGLQLELRRSLNAEEFAKLDAIK